MAAERSFENIYAENVPPNPVTLVRQEARFVASGGQNESRCRVKADVKSQKEVENRPRRAHPSSPDHTYSVIRRST